MVATAFFFLMVVIFLVAISFIILNLFFIIIWAILKRIGKHPKKRYVVIPTIFLVISLVAALIPLGWVGIVRSGNSSNAKKIVMAKSGKVVYWDESENSSSFQMDGTTYVECEYSCSTDTWKLGQPVANVRYKSDEKALNKFMKFVFAGDFTSTLYPVINEKRFSLYTIGSRLYCPKDQTNLISSYYSDISNYDTQNCRYSSCIYIDTKDKKATKGSSVPDFEIKYNNVTLNQNIFEKLLKINESQKLETIKISEKYIDIFKAKKPGTPFDGYNNITLISYSKDRVMRKEIELGLIDDQVYCIKEGQVDNIKGYHVPDDINVYLKDTIFGDK